MTSQLGRIGLLRTGLICRASWLDSSEKLSGLAQYRFASQSANKYPQNDSLAPKVVINRNPRNLERLRIGEKPGGWVLDKPGKCYWNKVTLDVTGKHVTATVQHFQGMTAVRASTQEWCIKKYLYSTKDSSAVETVGRVLAQRCLQTGLNEVYCYFTEEQLAKEKVKIFVKALEDGGLVLKEPDQLHGGEQVHLHYPIIQEKAWEVFEEIDEKILSRVPNKDVK